MAKIEAKVTAITPRLKAITKVFDSTYELNDEVGRFFVREMDRNIRQEGIWEKFPPNEDSTRYARVARGKIGQPMVGLIGHFKYSALKSRVVLFSDSPYVSLMHLGPKAKSWTIEPDEKPWLYFPHPTGRRVSWSSFRYVRAAKVTHRGWKKRKLFPDAYDVGLYFRKLISERIKTA